MISLILKMLMMQNHYNSSEEIEIAKGKYELPKTLTAAFQQIRRQWKKRK
jgi:hypothetical protein